MPDPEETYPEKMIRELKLMKKMIDEEIEGWRMQVHYIKTLTEAIKTQEDPL